MAQRSPESMARRRAAKVVWAKTPSGKASKAASDRRHRAKDSYVPQFNANMGQFLARRKEWLNELKLKSGCAHCGFDKHPTALQFHHLRDKTDGVSRMAFITRVSVDRLLVEIAKCIVLCANCHAILHAEGVDGQSLAQ